MYNYCLLKKCVFPKPILAQIQFATSFCILLFKQSNILLRICIQIIQQSLSSHFALVFLVLRIPAHLRTTLDPRRIFQVSCTDCYSSTHPESLILTHSPPERSVWGQLYPAIRNTCHSICFSRETLIALDVPCRSCQRSAVSWCRKKHAERAHANRLCFTVFCTFPILRHHVQIL